ncbi:hypothetical protein CBR_g46615 [Chara braunii]|uniref:F-box domain-containing protein n=1 Tax=Chara braunii TaxID=69332 RepID=A0A388M0Q0_CHABU|nr:hypothetical protein CBR_g46615 [Chara braunii]|eukprot:GBG88126.1 hypothetical protein CBR_g46615 [Chara braunii]
MGGVRRSIARLCLTSGGKGCWPQRAVRRRRRLTTGSKNAVGADIINSLPDALILDILGCVGDAKTVLRCAAVCRRFRDLIDRVPILRFEMKRWEGSFQVDINKHVTAAILRTTYLKSLTICCEKYPGWGPEVVEAWLAHTSKFLEEFSFKDNVAEDNCNFNTGVADPKCFLHRLVSSVMDHCVKLRKLEVCCPYTFNCLHLSTSQLESLQSRKPFASLEHLAVSEVAFFGCEYFEPPFGAFPNLKVLHLDKITGVKMAFVGSKSLKVLRLGTGFRSSLDSVTIDAPSLERLELRFVRSLCLDKGTMPEVMELDHCLQCHFSAPSSSSSSSSSTCSLPSSTSTSSAYYYSSFNGHSNPWRAKRVPIALSISLVYQACSEEDKSLLFWKAEDLVALISHHRRLLSHLSLEVDSVPGPESRSDVMAVSEALINELPQLQTLEIRRMGMVTWLEKFVEVKRGFSRKNLRGLLYAPKLESVDLCAGYGTFYTIGVLEMFLSSCPRLRSVTVRLFVRRMTPKKFFVKWKKLQQRHLSVQFVLLERPGEVDWEMVLNLPPMPFHSDYEAKVEYKEKVRKQLETPGRWYRQTGRGVFIEERSVL